jgi:hypothetical protein
VTCMYLFILTTTPILKLGMISFKARADCRAPDLDICYVCALDGYSEQFGLTTTFMGCMNWTLAKQTVFLDNTITSTVCGKFLRHVIHE